MNGKLEGKWALILGASSGHGGGTALELARAGMNIFGVHLDLRATLPQARQVAEQIEGMGRQVEFFNVNAADAAKRAQVITAIKKRLSSDERLRVVMHSLAFGALRPYLADDPAESVSQKQMEMTLDVMAHSLVYWVQDLSYKDLLGPGSKIFAMTSSGSHRVFPSYGPTGCAKAALEYHVRHLAVELSRRKIAVNSIQAGVTDTAALRKIPGHDRMLAFAQEYNPGGRVTSTEDVARIIRLMSNEENAWTTGNSIQVDGGEDLVMM